MLLKCCTQYVSKIGKLSSGHRTGKGQFSFQSQRRAVPMNAQTTIQLHSFCMLKRLCSKFFKLGFSSTWTKNFQMYKLDLENAEVPHSGEESASAGDTGNESLIPGSGRFSGEENGLPLQYSCLVNFMDREAWWITVHGVANSQTWLKQLNTEEQEIRLHWLDHRESKGILKETSTCKRLKVCYMMMFKSIQLV